jgi:uncharacterized membrane protein YphA (DoxX/SURF4 family)
MVTETGSQLSAQTRSVLRIVAALLFLQHGSAKLLHLGPWSVDAMMSSRKRHQRQR